MRVHRGGNFFLELLVGLPGSIVLSRGIGVPSICVEWKLVKAVQCIFYANTPGSLFVHLILPACLLASNYECILDGGGTGWTISGSTWVHFRDRCLEYQHSKHWSRGIFFFFYASWSLIFSCGRGLRPLDATFLALGQ